MHKEEVFKFQDKGLKANDSDKRLGSTANLKPYNKKSPAGSNNRRQEDDKSDDSS